MKQPLIVIPFRMYLPDSLAAMPDNGGHLLPLDVADAKCATELLDGLDQERLACERWRVSPGRPGEGAGLPAAIEHAALAQPL